MKTTAALLLLFAFTTPLKADGLTRFPVRLVFTMTSGSQIDGWAYYTARSGETEDSFFSKAYIERNFFVAPESYDSLTFTYYKHRVCYEYEWYNYDQYPVRARTCTETGMSHLRFADVLSIRVTEILLYPNVDPAETYNEFYLFRQYSASDTAWMRTPVQTRLSINTGVCVFEVFIHEKNPGIDKIIMQMLWKAAEYNNHRKESEISELIEKLKNRKVVVLSSPCMC